jgi:endonuclease/exonuclease/phosphatase family metal-dependent hydrolase
LYLCRKDYARGRNGAVKIRVMTYNILHCQDYIRSRREGKDIIDYDLIADTIRSQNADIVVLNEVRGSGDHPGYENQTRILAEKAGYPYYRFGEAIRLHSKLPFGNAILSRYPITAFEKIQIPDPEVKDEDAYYETRCVIKADIRIRGKELVVFGSHFGLANSEKKNAVNTVISLLDRCSRPHVLMGDFNMEPDDRKLKPIYDRMTDTAVLFDKPKLSFPADNPTVKIDYIFISKGIRAVYADIPDLSASDHRLVISDILI